MKTINKIMKRSSLVPFLCLLLISPETYSVSVINSPGEKWYEQYSEIKPNENSRVKHAHEIFQRVLKSAVSKPRGVEPFLRVIDKPTLEVFAIQGGGVILAAGALNKCYENTQYGDDRLAFILGHEIAHQVKDDFWHERFFHAVGRVRIGAVDNTEEQDALDRTVIIAKQTDHIMTKELKADGQGIIYSSLAGYNPRAIIDEDNKVNFFLEWVEALNPTRIGAPPSKTHPDPKDRATFVKVQLKNILKKVDTYELGVMFYIAGDFANALSAFSKFIDIYPSREVYSNLAASHHQLALNNLQLIEGDSDKMLFQLSISLDPNLRFIERWRGEDPKAAFQYHLDNAIKNYSYATSMDNRYLPALINLASAQILNDDADGAVSMLNNYLKDNAKTPDVLSNLGAAYYYSERTKRAKEKLLNAYQLNHSHHATLFNLGRLAKLEGNLSENEKYWTEYLSLYPHTSWANIVRKELKQSKQADTSNIIRNQKIAQESIEGISIGTGDENIESWQVKNEVNISLEKQSFLLRKHENGVTTVALLPDHTIILMSATHEYKGTAQNKVKIGDSEKKVKKFYGNPSNILELTQGQVWIYNNAGIAFRFRDSMITSWILFDNSSKA